MDALLSHVPITMWELVFLAAVLFAAGFVRGYTGFALSALAMVIAGPVFGPIFLIPVLFWQEISSSLLMLKSGWSQADRPMAVLLVLGSAVAMPFGISLTKSISVDVSAVIALSVIMVLAILQLAKVRFSFLDNRPGMFATGVVAGLVTGVSGAGGMVVALFALATNKSAAAVRASLVLYLLLSACVSFFTYTLMGVMTWAAVISALILLPVTLIGVLVGQRLFVPKYEKYYRPVCLSLLVGLASLGLINRIAAGS